MLFAAALLLLLPQATLQGTVRAEGSLLPVAEATVEIPELGRGVRTDRRGYFTLSDVPAGSWRVRVTAPRYTAIERVVEVPAEGTVTFSFNLAPGAVALEGLTVQGRNTARGLETGAGPPPTSINASVIAQTPSLSEPDVLRTLQTLPSVQAASDFSSALYVRGGLPDQNLLMLDGAPLFNPFHMGGLFSAFDPSAIESVDLLPGAFPARVGDRLSSAIDIRTRDGGRDRLRGSGAVGLTSTRMSLDGALPGGSGSYLLSARRTYLDLFTDAAHALDLIPGTLPYSFTDAHLKLSHDVGRLGQLSASFYLDTEDFRFPDGEPDPESASESALFDWGSRMATVRYWQPLGSSWVTELRAGVSDFHGSFGVQRFPWDQAAQRYRTDSTEVILDARTVQRDLFAAADFTGYGRAHTRRAGIQLDSYLLDHAVDLDEGEFGGVLTPFAQADRPWTIAAYVEDEWTATDALSVRAGVRVLSAGDRGTEWLPRLGVRYAPTERLALSFGVSRSAQVLRSLRSEESIWSSLTAYDLTAAVPIESGLSTAEDVTAGVEWSDGASSVRVDAYRKWMHDLALPPLPVDIVEAPMFAVDSLVVGEGSARGLELLARHARGRATYSLSYGLTFAELTRGEERYTPRFERRHLLDASAGLPLGKRGQFSARLSWGTGQSYTPILGTTAGFNYDPARQRFTREGTANGRTVLLGEHNGSRLPAYFRLDVGARRDYTRRWWGRETTVTPYISVLNVLNTPNVLFAIPEGYGGLQLEYPPQIPVFPTFGVEWKF